MNTAKAKSVNAMTKAELLAHFTAKVAALEARIVVGANMVRDLRTSLAMANQPAIVYTEAKSSVHKDYYAYIGARRAECKAAKQHVVSYVSFEEFSSRYQIRSIK